jgi:hypothetical protein
MSKIFTSASKIVFLMMAIGVHAALFTGKISGEQYMVLAGMAFTFYFANKGNNEPYAGK